MFRDDLKGELTTEVWERKKLEEAALQKSRDMLSKEEKDDTEVLALRKKLELKATSIASLEDEIKILKRVKPSQVKGGTDGKKAKEEVSQAEIKLLATEEDLEQTKTVLRQEENKTQTQALQVKMMKDRMFKLEEREEKYKTLEDDYRLAARQRNEAQTVSQTVRRQMADVKTLLEDEVKERHQTEKMLDESLIKLEAYESSSRSTQSVQVQTDDDLHSRPASRISERYGAISPAVHVFDGPASHRIVPGGFRGCNYAAGMQQESLVRPSSIKQNRIKIPASKEGYNMTFVQDVGSKSEPTDDQPPKKCVIKVTKARNQPSYNEFKHNFFK